MKKQCVFINMASPYLDLLIRGDGTEDNLCESLSGKHPEADASDHTAVFNQSQCLVFSAVTQRS